MDLASDRVVDMAWRAIGQAGVEGVGRRIGSDVCGGHVSRLSATILTAALRSGMVLGRYRPRRALTSTLSEGCRSSECPHCSGSIWLTRRELIFFFLTSYLVVLAAGLITHLHALLILSSDLPPCPPLNPVSHIILLASVALDPPPIDAYLILALQDAEETLRKGSKSFDTAKLAFGREMRVGLVAIYAWCRVTVSRHVLSGADSRTTSLTSLNRKSRDRPRLR